MKKSATKGEKPGFVFEWKWEEADCKLWSLMVFKTKSWLAEFKVDQILSIFWLIRVFLQNFKTNDICLRAWATLVAWAGGCINAGEHVLLFFYFFDRYCMQWGTHDHFHPS